MRIAGNEVIPVAAIGKIITFTEPDSKRIVVTDEIAIIVGIPDAIPIARIIRAVFQQRDFTSCVKNGPVRTVR